MNLQVNPRGFLNFLIFKGAFCLAVTSDSRFLVTGATHHIRIFDLQTKEQVFHFENAHSGTTKYKDSLDKSIGGVRSIALSPDDKYIVTSPMGGTLKIFDFQTWQLVHTFESPRLKSFESTLKF